MAQITSLFNFFQPNIVNTEGGFYALDDLGQPLQPNSGNDNNERRLHDTARMVHCFAIAKLLERPAVDDIINHGMDFLWTRHRDAKNGGYFWGVGDNVVTDSTKQAYGHAFVLLAASSAKIVAHPDAERLLNDVSEVLFSRFWEFDKGAASEEYSADWQTISKYRGQNSNMHLTEALMAAYEATGKQVYLEMATSIAELIINRHARKQGWRVAEHFDVNWQIDHAYVGDPVFRPAGTTPGHALEWARLLIQLWELDGREADWMPEAAKNLFLNAVNSGWSYETGGFFYTLTWNNTPDQTDRFCWPAAEGIAAAAVLNSYGNNPLFETWYRRIWGFVDAHLIDHEQGGWFTELDSNLRPVSRIFRGKPDLYHALQACLIPLLSTDGSITRGLGLTPLHMNG